MPSDSSHMFTGEDRNGKKISEVRDTLSLFGAGGGNHLTQLT